MKWKGLNVTNAFCALGILCYYDIAGMTRNEGREIRNDRLTGYEAGMSS